MIVLSILQAWHLGARIAVVAAQVSAALPQRTPHPPPPLVPLPLLLFPLLLLPAAALPLSSRLPLLQAASQLLAPLLLLVAAPAAAAPA